MDEMHRAARYGKGVELPGLSGSVTPGTSLPSLAINYLALLFEDFYGDFITGEG